MVKCNKHDENIDGGNQKRRKPGEHPKDHGYAWIVLIGGIIEMGLIMGIQKSSGLLFVAFQEKFHSSSSMTSLPSTVQNVFYSVTALFATNIGMKLTTSRNLTIIGSTLMCISYIVTSQADDVRILLLSHGVLHGIATALMLPATLVTISHYFDARRGFANSLAISGSCIGGLIFAPLITSLLSTYGYSGCILIISAVLLNGCVCGALLRPTSFYSKHHRQKTDSEIEENQPLNESLVQKMEDDHMTKSDNKAPDKEKIIFEMFGPKHELISSTHSLEVHKDISMPTRERASTFVDYRYINSNDRKVHLSSKEFISSSSFDIPLSSTPTTKMRESLHKNGFKNNILKPSMKPENGKEQNISDWLRAIGIMFDYRLFYNPVFVSLLLTASFICPPTVMVTIYIAPYAKDVGVSNEGVALLVLVNSFVDLVARVLLGYISDRGWLRRSTLVGITTMTVSICCFTLRFFTSFGVLMGYAVVLGMVSGLYFAIYPVVITDYMTLNKLDSCLGYTALINGCSNAGTFFIVGYLRDISGSYISSYYFIGSQAFIGACIMFLLPYIERFYLSRLKRQKLESTSR
ncbi:Major Facilitator superfamily [Mactra antiquata]